MAFPKYEDIVVEVSGGIGVIKFNRPKSLNAFGGNMIPEAIDALRILNDHSDTTFTVITGEGRFFSAGADVRGTELMRSMIDHKKIVVLALNGPAVGAGAAWFPGVADIVLASDKTYFQIPFSALGLVPENGSAVIFAQSMGVHRANEFLMFGTKLSAQDMEKYGIVNKIFPSEGFHGYVKKYLEEHLKDKDAKSMMEVKRLQNASTRDQRIVAVFNSVDALSERFVEGAPVERFKLKMQELEGKCPFHSMTVWI
ncbi:hypothetical protein D0Z07_7942 [Hyphodiscus hymeniophilus]|uniref:Enoyl-CoA hydratase n=1 Tax=Hyphodiscus hymeniophilus TaxID=353542 RepID=A0A9P6SQD2_9HELO|nr:hypothetical protein D0Z07_7942 [Hyphodiscus hymeniophilus]